MRNAQRMSVSFGSESASQAPLSAYGVTPAAQRSFSPFPDVGVIFLFLTSVDPHPTRRTLRVQMKCFVYFIGLYLCYVRACGGAGPLSVRSETTVATPARPSTYPRHRRHQRLACAELDVGCLTRLAQHPRVGALAEGLERTGVRGGDALGRARRRSTRPTAARPSDRRRRRPRARSGRSCPRTRPSPRRSAAAPR